MIQGHPFERTRLLDLAAGRGKPWDVIVIGAGATGLGIAVDAALRGYGTLLLERGDFGSGTSSRTTKLIHGGVRYLAQGNVPFVRRSLVERGLLLRNAPHLVRPVPFIIPCYRGWERSFYGLGLAFYDALAGSRSLGRTLRLDTSETARRLETVRTDGLRGGVCYFDGQFDDARLALCLAQTCADEGGIPLNYVRVTGFDARNGRVEGVRAVDRESGTEYRFRGRVVVNATGVFADEVRRLEDPDAKPMLRPSQGVHLVLPREFLPSDAALMIPRTDDGRLLFAIPWNDRVLLGTTDTPVGQASSDPRPFEHEVGYLLSHAGRYLSRRPERSDVLSQFAGLRPLVSDNPDAPTHTVSRDHTILVSRGGLVTVTGGKWTTYRYMAEQAVDRAARLAGLPERNSVTEHHALHGWTEDLGEPGLRRGYGSDLSALDALAGSLPDADLPLHARLPYRWSHVVWAARHEMARTVEDVLARRTRALFLDAQAAVEAATRVAAVMARELGKDREWERREVEAFLDLARGFLPTS